jgi:hypothetical protein
MANNYLRRFQRELHEQGSMAIQEIAETGVSKGIQVIGESGVGKTYAFDTLTREFPSYNEGVQRVVPVVRIGLDITPRARPIMEAALKALGRPIGPREKITFAKVEEMLYSALRACKTKVFMIEEFHNGLVANKSEIRTENCNFLKNLWNMHNPENPETWVSATENSKPYGMLIIVSGVETLQKVIAKNKELKTRYGTLIEAPSLALFPKPLYNEFRQVLKSKVEQFGLGGRVDVEDHLFSARVYFSSEAHLRTVNDVVQRVGTLARTASQETPIQDIFAKSVSQMCGQLVKEIGNPFYWSEDEVVQRVMKAQLKFDSGVR